MTTNTSDIRAAWQDRREAYYSDQGRAEFATSLLKELAKGQPVTPGRVAEIAGGLIESQAASLLVSAGELGAEIDESGSLVGNALTLIPTQHRFQVDGVDLYAWCALDTLFLPALLDETAHVETPCPETGETITLVIGPEGLREYSPDTARASVVVPGETPSCDLDSITGPDSATCSQMHFFATLDAAESWAKDHPGVAIVTVEDANQIARVLADEPCGECC